MSPYGKLNLWDAMCQIEAERQNYDRFHAMTIHDTFVEVDAFEAGEDLKDASREHFVDRMDAAMTHILERLGVDLSRLDQPEEETEG